MAFERISQDPLILETPGVVYRAVNSFKINMSLSHLPIFFCPCKHSGSSNKVLFKVFPCREAGLSVDQSLQVRSRLERLKSEADEILVCLKYLDFIINNGNKQ